MTDTSTTIRERVAKAISLECFDWQGIERQDAMALRAADAAIAIVVEVFRNGQSSLLDKEAKNE